MLDRIHDIVIPYGAAPAQLEGWLSRSAAEADAACRALRVDGSTEALAVLLRATGNADWTIRRLAVEALGLHPRGAETAPALRALLRDPSDHVVRTACQALAQLGDVACHDEVVGLLRAREASTREVAALALDALWRGEDAWPLLAVMTKDANADVRKQAAWVLRNHAGPATWRRLFELWHADPLPRHRAWACTLAGIYGDRDVRSLLVALGSDSDGHVRHAAAEALNMLDQPRGERHVGRCAFPTGRARSAAMERAQRGEGGQGNRRKQSPV